MEKGEGGDDELKNLKLCRFQWMQTNIFNQTSCDISKFSVYSVEQSFRAFDTAQVGFMISLQLLLLSSIIPNVWVLLINSKIMESKISFFSV